MDGIHLHHCVVYRTQKGMNAAAVSRNFYKVFGDHAVSDRIYRKWFKKFKHSNLHLKVKPCSGRPSVVIDEIIWNILMYDPSSVISNPAKKIDGV